MPNFDEILKKSLSAVNDGYGAALEDLNNVVEKLALAIKGNAGEQFNLELAKVSEDIKGATFRVYLDPDPEDANVSLINVGHFRLLSSGYPIYSGLYNKSSSLFSPEREFSDVVALEGFFAELLASPDSTLIQAIGFAIRKKASKSRV